MTIESNKTKRSMNLTPLARGLRNNLTDAEKRLWYYLRGKNLKGLKFRRQAPMGSYIVDFACFQKKLVVELDGGQHMEAAQSNKDTARDAWLKKRGFTVLRFWDNEVLKDTEAVVGKILEYL